MKAKVIHVKGLQFVGESETGHAIVMDGDRAFGGENTGPRPMELLLLGLGGCTGMDVVSILQKKRQELEGLEIIVDGKKAEEYPKRFTDVNIEFRLKGKNLSEEAVKRAIELSMEKYCSVKATLEGDTKVSFKYTIIHED
ncbi:MAG: OsmC family protein [Thermodesulfovibrionales bacterium]|nr:OsmC family protein [Thermodesulfovibrionales bacterium]